MKIGIDLDNTIICYENSFRHAIREVSWFDPKYQFISREKLKNDLCSLQGGQEKWEKIQGAVYGRLIANARLYDFVTRFLIRCKYKKITVDIISHKTIYAHHDKNGTKLRELALEFLNANGLRAGRLGLINQIYFESTQEEKIERINVGNYDYFIDDLAEVIEKLSGNIRLKTILFNGASKAKDGKNWQEIETYLFENPSKREIEYLYELIVGFKARVLNQCTLGGNALVFKISSKNADEKLAAIKLYSGKNAQVSFERERTAASFFEKIQFKFVPKLLHSSESLVGNIFSWIDGDAIEIPSAEDVDQLLDFVRFLYEQSKKIEFTEIPIAASSLLNYAKFVENLKERIQILCNSSAEYPALDLHLRTIINPAFFSAIGKLEKIGYSGSSNRSLSKDQLIISPSDFGFHNALKDLSGTIHFIDFEYFGWDDPAKLALDFLFHPAMKLNFNLKKQWINGCVEIFGQDFKNRFEHFMPIIKVAWSIIILNEFREDVWAQRSGANPKKREKRDHILSNQLDISRAILEEIDEN